MPAFPQWIQAEGERLQYLTFFALFVALAVAEWLAPRRTGPMARSRRWPANLGLTALNVVALGLLPVSFVGAALWADSRHLGLLRFLALPTAALVPATLLARGFISFATHWMMHKVPLFWRLHRVHHLDTDLDVSTTVRFHPLEFLAGVLPGVPLVVLLGLTPWVLVLYEILDVAVNLFSHANVRVPARLGRALRYVIVTPDLHRIHHSSWQPETDSNFSAVFPIWDLMFGTLRTEPRDRHETMRLGLDEVREPRAHRVGWLLGSVRRRDLRRPDLSRPRRPRAPVAPRGRSRALRADGGPGDGGGSSSARTTLPCRGRPSPRAPGGAIGP